MPGLELVAQVSSPRTPRAQSHKQPRQDLADTTSWADDLHAGMAPTWIQPGLCRSAAWGWDKAFRSWDRSAQKDHIHAAIEHVETGELQAASWSGVREVYFASSLKSTYVEVISQAFVSAGRQARIMRDERQQSAEQSFCLCMDQDKLAGSQRCKRFMNFG